jgi:hypothetical protein
MQTADLESRAVSAASIHPLVAARVRRCGRSVDTSALPIISLRIFAVVGVQPTVHTLDNIRVKPDDHTLNLFSLLLVSICFLLSEILTKRRKPAPRLAFLTAGASAKQQKRPTGASGSECKKTRIAGLCGREGRASRAPLFIFVLF